jgi:hypothetical protein
MSRPLLDKSQQHQQHALETGAALSPGRGEAQDGLRLPIAAAAAFLPSGHGFPPLATQAPVVFKSHPNRRLPESVLSGAGSHFNVREALIPSPVTLAAFSTTAPANSQHVPVMAGDVRHQARKSSRSSSDRELSIDIKAAEKSSIAGSDVKTSMDSPGPKKRASADPIDYPRRRATIAASLILASPPWLISRSSAKCVDPGRAGVMYLRLLLSHQH